MKPYVLIFAAVLSAFAQAGGLGELTGDAARKRTREARRRRDALKDAIRSANEAIANKTLQIEDAQMAATNIKNQFAAWKKVLLTALPAQIALQNNLQAREREVSASIVNQLKSGRQLEWAFTEFANYAQDTSERARAALKFADYVKTVAGTDLPHARATLVALSDPGVLDTVSDSASRVSAARASLERQHERLKKAETERLEALRLYSALKSRLER